MCELFTTCVKTLRGARMWLDKRREPLELHLKSTMNAQRRRRTSAVARKQIRDRRARRKPEIRRDTLGPMPEHIEAPRRVQRHAPPHNAMRRRHSRRCEAILEGATRHAEQHRCSLDMQARRWRG